MRISDWSSDVCSSDLAGLHFNHTSRMASCCRHDGLFDFERKTVFDPATAAYNAARREARPSPRLSRPPAGNHTPCAAPWRAPGSIPGLALMAGLTVPPEIGEASGREKVCQYV